MTHRFPIKEIARQAGMGTATVDRVLNKRAHVSPQTRNRVQAAIAELEAQEMQLTARGRRMFIDFVVEAPSRFSQQVRHAAQNVLPRIGVGVFRPRFVFQEILSDSELIDALKRILKRGSQGVCLKARNVPAVQDMVHQLTKAGIPVVTLVTDLPDTPRVAYVGLDNVNAGRVAAYLTAATLQTGAKTVLTTRSQTTFLGESERDQAFRDTLSQSRPDLEILDVTGGAGLPSNTLKRLDGILDQADGPDAVYSMGGGNKAILNHLVHQGRAPGIYVAHDLDRENRQLLRDHQIDFVLHHDLQTDMENLFLSVAAYHGLGAARSVHQISDSQIITPFNIPPEVP